MQTLCILGRLPKIGQAELESLYGADKLRIIGVNAVSIDLEPSKIDFSRLGGTVKFCKVLTTLDTTNWGEIQKYLETTIPKHLGYLPEGKMKLGFSVYSLGVSPARINASGLELKKIIKTSGRSVRVIPNKETFLNSAQVLHNQLTSALGWELIFVRDGQKTIIAQNIAEQDIEAYAKRDQARPKRDARVGMLPPKLAQTIINLGVGYIADQPILSACGPDSDLDTPDLVRKTILDPFCGTGVILQEAALMGYKVVGTDIDDRMIDFSRENLRWLEASHRITIKPKLDVADATHANWDGFDCIASETNLGRPFSSPPKPEELKEVISNVNTIIKKTLINISRQTNSGFRLCLALPTWYTQNSFQHLPLLANLTDMGYNRLSFVHAANEDLIYHREGQIVGRELVTLIRK